MSIEILKVGGQIAGIGGIALGIFLILFRDIIGKTIFPQLTKQQGFRLLVLISILVWSIALAGIGAWVWATNHSRTPSISSIDQTVDEKGIGVINTGEGNVTITNSSTQ